MRKSLGFLVGLGVVVSIQAGTFVCNIPVTKCEPVFKKIIKKIPQKQCWDEVQTSPIRYLASASDCQASGLVVAKKCTVTKCKTVYESIEEHVLVGYKNSGIACDGHVVTKTTNCKLKTIPITVTY
jgi:hypothetical protein